MWFFSSCPVWWLNIYCEMITTVKLIKTHPSLHTVTFVCVVRTLRVLADFKYTIWYSSLVAQMVKNLPAMQETQVWSLGPEDSLEKGMATHSSILAWRILWTEEPGGLQSMWSQRVGHDWATNTQHNTNIITVQSTRLGIILKSHTLDHNQILWGIRHGLLLLLNSIDNYNMQPSLRTPVLNAVCLTLLFLSGIVFGDVFPTLLPAMETD